MADYYMTKYQSKAQQALSAAMGPITAGLRRFEAEAQAQAEAEAAPLEETSVASLARAKLRRMVFSANRSHWFSGCELCIFVLTGGHCVQTHRSKEIFLGRAHYLMHECQRVLNGETSQTGPLQASFTEVVDVVTLAPEIAETGSEARELVARVTAGDLSASADGGVPEPADGDGAAHGEGSGVEEPADGDIAAHGGDEEAGDKEVGASGASRTQLQVFTETTGLRDDWLHRGFALADLDLYQYSIVIERVRLPPLLISRPDAGNVFPFDAHYRLANNYCQQITTWPRTVPRLVGSACPRSDAGHGEDYGCWMATLFTPLRCPGPGGCADPLQCSAALVEQTMPRRQGGGAREPAARQRAAYSFALAWRLRGAEIQGLARRGRAKTDASKRIPVAMDTTLCKRWCPEESTLAHSLLQRATVHQMLYQRGRSATCVERPVDLILEAWGVPTGHHPHQLYVDEFCACKSVDVIMNIDLGVASRNTAKETAKKRSGLHLQPDDDGGAAEPAAEARAPLEFEDVGGQAIDEADEPENEEVEKVGSNRMLVMDKVQDVKWIARLLGREKEIAKARQPGVTPDDCKAMEKVAKVYGSLVGGIFESFPVEPRECLGFYSAAPLALEMQARRAEVIRRQVDGSSDDAEELVAEEVHSSIARPPSVELFDVEDVLAGPRQVGWKLCQAAELNADQKRAVALVVQPMQAAWEKALDAAELTSRNAAREARVEEARKLLPLVGALVRLLLVGGGGCGKTRIFNKVLVPLLEEFYGPQSVMKEASSNKAARLLHGKTMHAANKLTGNSSLRTVHLRLDEQRAKVLGNISGKIGATIIDEHSQTSAKLFHADAYITSLARAPIYKLAPERYAHPLETWGCLPVVCVGGDELQLPPVPMQASLLAPLEGCTDEHKAGVAIFAGLKHVYRLTTAMRFDDPVLIAILAKMRTPGDAKLTVAEWASLEATEARTLDDLDGTEDWFEACYTWSVVTMASAIRSKLSARASKAVLFVAQAEDEIVNPWPEMRQELVRRSVGEQLLRHPNMNSTGRLPGFAMFHIGMRGRLTQSVEPPEGVVDATGEVIGVDLHPMEPQSHKRCAFHCDGVAEPVASVVVLRPSALVRLRQAR